VNDSIHYLEWRMVTRLQCPPGHLRCHTSFKLFSYVYQAVHLPPLLSPLPHLHPLILYPPFSHSPLQPLYLSQPLLTPTILAHPLHASLQIPHFFGEGQRSTKHTCLPASLAIRTIHQNPYPSTPFLRSVDAWLLLYLVQDSLQGNLHTPSSRFRFLTPIAASRRI
jgi:hypothetical protein